MLQIEKELRCAFPALSFYFDTVFAWIKNTGQATAIKSMAVQTGKTEYTLCYAFLFGQVSEQIKAEQSQNLVPVWEYLLDKLSDLNHFSAERVQELRAEMGPYIK